MNLPEALDYALSRFYSAPTGLLGQLLTILRFTPQGQAGRPADALGVSASTWNAWLLGARGMAGGRQPSHANAARIREAARRAKAAGSPAPFRARVTAFVKWHRYYNANPYRGVNLDSLWLDPMVQAWRAGAGVHEVEELFSVAVEARYGGPVEFLTDAEYDNDSDYSGQKPARRVSGGVSVTLHA